MIFDKGYRQRETVKLNVQAVQASAKAQGLRATFMTLTFKWLDDWPLMRQEVSVFVKRLRRRSKRAGLYVLERGRQFGRPHLHFALDGFVAVAVLRACTKGLRYVGNEPDIEKTEEGNLEKYFYKEMWKQTGRRDLPGRRWGRFGKLAVGEWVKETDIRTDSAWAKCLEYAWALWTGGQSKRSVWETAVWLYKLYIKGEFNLDGGDVEGATETSVKPLDGERELREGVWFPARSLWPAQGVLTGPPVTVTSRPSSSDSVAETGALRL